MKKKTKKTLAETRASFGFANKTLQMAEEEHRACPAPLRGRDQTKLAGPNYTKQRRAVD